MKILVTGAAGFIGSHLCWKLLGRGDEVFGIDNLNDYYPVSLKYARLREGGILESEIVQGHKVKSAKYGNFRFQRLDISDKSRLMDLFERERFDVVVNLAAQAGVRYSIENPDAYVESNVVGFLNVLEGVRRYPVKHLVYASSSSVYGGNTKTPFSESDRVDNQVSIYAATKKTNELMANVYNHLYGVPTTGLRFFTVYGPWGRPDMAPMLFTKAIMQGKAIKVFNNGNMSRDFTYIDDIVNGTVGVIDSKPQGSRVYNIGCGHPTQLMDFIQTLEACLGKKAEMEMLPMQPGDVYQTYADTSKLEDEIGYRPATLLADGIAKFVEWYKAYNNI